MHAAQSRSQTPDLWISRAAVTAMLGHVGTRSWQERVGVLIGIPGKALEALRLANSTNGPGAFRLEASELARASRWAARQGHAIVALYHNHPNGDLRLSTVDRHSLLQSSWPWLLVASEEGGLQARCYAPATCASLQVDYEASLYRASPAVQFS